MEDAVKVHDGDTEGLSPKAVLAALFPAISTLTLVVVNGLFSGFDQTELQGAVVGVVLSGLAFVGAALGSTGVVKAPTTQMTGSDELLPTPAVERMQRKEV